MKIVRRLEDLHEGQRLMSAYCFYCGRYIPMSNSKGCAWVTSDTDDGAFTCCSMKCAKELMARLEDENVQRATR